MSKPSVEIDSEKLNRAREILGTRSIRDTGDAAFREVIRIAAIRDLAALAEEGAFGALLEPTLKKGGGGEKRSSRSANTARPTAQRQSEQFSVQFWP